MKTRLAVSIVSLALVAVLLGSASREAHPAEPAYCSDFTPSRLLQDPQIAGQLYGAMERGDASAQARFEQMVSEMRAVHGCGELDTPAAAVPHAPSAPRLPPGHPPVPRTPASPTFSDDARVISI